MEILGGNYKQQSWGPRQSGRAPKQGSKAQRMVGVRFLLARQLSRTKLFSPSIRWIFVVWGHINNATNCFSRWSYWQKSLYLPPYMPTHELKDLAFVFPATSEDITKGSKSLLLPQHSAVFALQTKQTEPGSWVDEKFPSKKTFTEV